MYLAPLNYAQMLQDYGYAWYYAELTSAEQQACYTTTILSYGKKMKAVASEAREGCGGPA